jgi:PAS domain S-box-containing protein
LEAFVRDAPDMIALVDRSHQVRRANHLRHGFSVEQVVGRPVEDLLPEADRELARAAIDRVFQLGTPTAYEATVATPEAVGRYRARLEPVREGGVTTHVSVALEDTTAASRAHDEAEHKQALVLGLERINRVIFGAGSTEEMLDAVLSEMLALFDCDRAWLAYPCDPDAAEFSIVHERTVPEFPGALGSTIPVDAEVAERFRCALAHAGEAVRNDPESNPVGDRPSAMLDYGIKSMLFAAITSIYSKPWLLGIHHCREPRAFGQEIELFSAVVARVREGLEVWLSQRAIRESEERFRLLVEHAPDAIVILDAETRRFVTVNQKAVELFGMEREALLERGPLEVSPEFQPNGAPSRERAPALIEAALKGQDLVFEWTHQNARGEPLECEVRLLLLPDPTHHRLRGSITHIAGRKRAERENERLTAQLFQAQKMQALGQLTGGVAHDFNNLLTVIGGSLAMIELEAANPERVHYFGQLASEASQRAALLTQRLLAFSRQQPLRPCLINAGELVRGMEPLLRRSLGETVRIEIATQPDLWSCEVDPAQLENVILNLAINARDAMPEGGCLAIETSNVVLGEELELESEKVRPGEYVLLAVTDNGTGIEPELMGKLFEPFFTTKEIGKGSGLGLSMVYGFAKQSGGHTKIYSQRGRGTTVKLCLPRSLGASSQPQASVEQEPATPLGAGERVLVVEDDANLRALVVQLLHRAGYRTFDVGRGLDALTVLEREPEVALLLSDIVLPDGMNGVEVARRAHDVRPRLPVLFMSGYTEDAVIHDGRLDAGVALLEKPFSTAALARAVAGALQRRD